MTNLKEFGTEYHKKAHRIFRSLPNPGDHLSKDQKGLEGRAESIRQAKHVTFLDFPFDIRFMIYKEFFGHQDFSDREWQTYLKSFTGRIYSRSHVQNSHTVMPLLQSLASNNMRRVTAHNKISLLLTRKSIFSEASGLFYQLHTFYVPTPDELHKRPVEISTTVQAVLDKIERIALFYEESTYDSAYNRNFNRHISVLPVLYAQLKVLSIDFQGFNFQFDEGIMLALQTIWTDLQLLRLCIFHKKREALRTMNLSSIAPGFHWFRELEDGSAQVESYPHRIRPGAGASVFLVNRRRQILHQGLRDFNLALGQQTPETEEWIPFRSSRKMALNPEIAYSNA